jgi:hypothetical protein
MVVLYPLLPGYVDGVRTKHHQSCHGCRSGSVCSAGSRRAAGNMVEYEYSRLTDVAAVCQSTDDC